MQTNQILVAILGFQLTFLGGVMLVRRTIDSFEQAGGGFVVLAGFLLTLSAFVLPRLLETDGSRR